MRNLKQSTAANVMVFMTDSADHVAGKTGLTLTITASKDGVAFASISPTVTERGSGWYNLALTTAHTDTLGDLALHATATGADPTDLLCRVTARVVDDVLPTASYIAPDNASIAAILLDTAEIGAAGAGLTALASAANLATVAGYLDTEVLAIKAKTDNLPASPAATGDAMALTAAAVDAIMDEVIDGGYTMRELLRGFASALMAKLSGADVNSPAFRDVADTKNRITATTDASGNRTAVTLDLT